MDRQQLGTKIRLELSRLIDDQGRFINSYFNEKEIVERILNLSDSYAHDRQVALTTEKG